MYEVAGPDHVRIVAIWSAPQEGVFVEVARFPAGLAREAPVGAPYEQAASSGHTDLASYLSDAKTPSEVEPLTILPGAGISPGRRSDSA
jgi:hypothetical protein